MQLDEFPEVLPVRPYRRHYGTWRDWPGQGERPRWVVQFECLACSREALGPARCEFCGGSVVVADEWTA